MPFFFSKKRFLIDYLEGFVDIHNHILPGIDDGAKTVADSITMLKAFSEFGVNRFIATPHIMQNYYPNTPETITSALEVLKDEMLKENLKHIRIEAAAEHMIDADFEALLRNHQVMPMNKMYLLIEMSYLQPPLNFDEAISKTASNRFFPILAHPERYHFIPSNLSKYRKYKEKGVLFQMNLLSLSDYYGKDVQKKAFKLLDEGLIDFIGTDIHNQSQLQFLKELKIPPSEIKKLLPVIDNTIQTFF